MVVGGGRRGGGEHGTRRGEERNLGERNRGHLLRSAHLLPPALQSGDGQIVRRNELAPAGKLHGVFMIAAEY